MKELQRRAAQDSEKPFPGCMGRMVNLFDLGAGMPGNRLLTDRAHRDGSPNSRGTLDAEKKTSDSTGRLIEDKLVAYEYRRNSSKKKSNGTPMKMLIAQEMSNEPGSRRRPPSVVARLMGLDAFPAQQPISEVQESSPEGFLYRSARQQLLLRYQQEQPGFQFEQMSHEIYPPHSSIQGSPEYKDVYEVWQQNPRGNQRTDQLCNNRRPGVEANEKKMALVRQKFMEAKRLATDDKLRQSKEFQDALEVLSSNRDLFLKFLQEPNSLISKHFYEPHSIPPLPETKRITVLKPSKTMDVKGVTPIKKQSQVVEVNGWDGKKPIWSTASANPRTANCSSQPTRIVVLKPSPGMAHDTRAMGSSPIPSPGQLHPRDFQKLETDVAKVSREIAEEITKQMQENLSKIHSDEFLVSSVLSNGYVGDESSFDKSECEYVEEGNISASESSTPTSRHSWDYVDKYKNAFSSPSFSRASCSPESSVSREAKKRLSERWAMMASNGNGQEPRQIRRSSSTLGEMLALCETKKSKEIGGDEKVGLPSMSGSRSCGGEQELGVLTSCLSGVGSTNGDVGDSPRNLMRSQSVPVSSTAYEKVGVTVEAHDSKFSKDANSNEATKLKTGKSSLKGKVSSLFFSRNKKLNKEKPCPSSGNQIAPQLISPSSEGSSEVKQLQVEDRSNISDFVTSTNLEELQTLSPGEDPSKSSYPAPSNLKLKQGSPSSEVTVTLAKPELIEHTGENQDQPSPISVLDAPFDDDNNNQDPSMKVTLDRVSHHRLLKSADATAKSPLIVSVSRSLSWDDSLLDSPRSSCLHDPSVLSFSWAEKEQEWFLFVQMLLSAAGFDHEIFVTVSSKWYSPEKPVDPLLLDKIALWKDEEQVNQGKRRQLRSEKKLVYDCVNAALLEMVASTSDAIPWVITPRKRMLPAGPVIEEVWTRVKEWSQGEEKNCLDEIENSALVVETAVRQEVERSNWVDFMRAEVDLIGNELEKEVLSKLVDEAVVELRCGF